MTVKEFENEDLVLKDGKVFFNKRNCPFCNNIALIKGISEETLYLSCVDHPNWNHYITSKNLCEILKNGEIM